MIVVVIAGCDNVITERYGTLTSPGHTRVPYPNSQMCTYTIETEGNEDQQPVTLTVNRFDVVQEDYLQLFDGSDSSGKALHPDDGFGGLVRPKSSYVSKSGKFHLLFTSNPIKSGKGWNITYSTSMFLPRIQKIKRFWLCRRKFPWPR